MIPVSTVLLLIGEPHIRILIHFILSTAGITTVLLRETEINPNTKNNDGDTPLHLACSNYGFEAVQLLVRDPRCNPLEKNSSGDTALHAACRLDGTGEADLAHTSTIVFTYTYTVHVAIHLYVHPQKLECSKEHVPRTEHPAGVGRVAHTSTRRSVRLVRAA